MSLTSTRSPEWCIISTIKVRPLRKTEPHKKNSSLQQIFRTPIHRHYNISIRNRKMKLSLTSQRPPRGCVRSSQQRVCDQKLLMLRDSNYWHMFNRRINLSAEDLGSSKPISSTSIYFANWISLWLIWNSIFISVSEKEWCNKLYFNHQINTHLVMRIQSFSPVFPSALYSSAFCGAFLLPGELPVWTVTELSTWGMWNNWLVIVTDTAVSNTQFFTACY